LPVTLVSFTGTASGSQALLRWKTANEQSFKQFELEWSNDGNHWQQISVVPAQGGAAGSADYSAYHNLAAGVNYYRLRMVDIDGRFTFSNVIRLQTGVQKGILVYPNPAVNTITLSLPAPGEAAVKIFSNAGSLVYESTVSGNSVSINIEKLATGLYTVLVNQGGNVFTERIIKK
jgi:hypothetical protein